MNNINFTVMSENSKSRTSYKPEEKAAIVLSVMNRKTTIQKVCKDKQIAATLISLWKKQAEEAILERFTNSRPGRRKQEPSSEDIKGGIRAARVDARTAKTRATRLENSLKTARERIAMLENAIAELACAAGCKVVKPERVRGKKG